MPTAAIGSLRQSYRGASEVRLLIFDRTLDALDFALANAAVLGYPLAYAAQLEALRRDHFCAVALPHASAELSWRLYLADFPLLLTRAEPLPPPHAIFFDPYSPAVNREMWTLELFHRSARAAATGDPVSADDLHPLERRAGGRFWLAGVPRRHRPSTGEKDQPTVATNALGLLGGHWIGPVWKIRSTLQPTRPVALERPACGPAPISESDFARLRAHQQFAAGLF